MLLTVSSDEKSGKELYDVAYYALRQMLSGVKGIIAPAAYGRIVEADLYIRGSRKTGGVGDQPDAGK